MIVDWVIIDAFIIERKFISNGLKISKQIFDNLKDCFIEQFPKRFRTTLLKYLNKIHSCVRKIFKKLFQ